MADDGHSGELAAPIGTEAPVVAGGVEIAPVEVGGVAREVAPVPGGRAPAELVHVLAESLHRAHLEPVQRPDGGVGRVHPALLPVRPST